MISKYNTYCHKFLTVLHRLTHTLVILFEYGWSMARVWLEYGWSMARAWLEIATPHSDHRSENAYTHRTEGLSPCASPPVLLVSKMLRAEKRHKI
jgi:hypothetical protein